jgi:hypothetical protein
VNSDCSEDELKLSPGGTAWMVAAMLLTQAALGLSRANRHVLRRLHTVLGILLLPLTFVHCWLSMTTVSMRSANATGLWIATAAFLLLAVELSLGATLIRSSESARLRSVHLAVGLGIVFPAGVHVLVI